jgi:hypothetical protein
MRGSHPHRVPYVHQRLPAVSLATPKVSSHLSWVVKSAPRSMSTLAISARDARSNGVIPSLSLAVTSALRSISIARRDDLETLAYVLKPPHVLPSWRSSVARLQGSHLEEKYNHIAEMMTAPTDLLCHSHRLFTRSQVSSLRLPFEHRAHVDIITSLPSPLRNCILWYTGRRSRLHPD